MSLRSSAARYARALFDVASQEADAAKVGRDLEALAAMFREHRELSDVLTSPGVPVAARQGVVKALADRVGADAPLAKVLALLAERGRLELLPDLAAVYAERLLAHRNVVQAQVTTAAPLGPEKAQALEQSLAAVTGKQVQVTVEVDPALIGGLVARIGSTVYDGSVRTQLAKMRQQLVEQA